MMAPLAMVLGLFAPVCYAPPVSAVITVPYVQPACAYCSGHRGIQYAVATGTPVTAVSDGVVVFAGAVAGTRYVVVLHPDGMRATYGMLASASVRSGEVVHVGQVVGLSAVHLYFGLRDAANAPVDPAPLLGRLVGRARLLPTDGIVRKTALDPHVPSCGRLGARVHAPPTAGEEQSPWLSSRCAKCWKQVSTSGTRPVGGTRR